MVNIRGLDVFVLGLPGSAEAGLVPKGLRPVAVQVRLGVVCVQDCVKLTFHLVRCLAGY